MKNLLVISSYLILLLTSCGKDNLPIIRIETPTEEQQFSMGDTIFFSGDVTYDKEVGLFGFELLGLNFLPMPGLIQTIETERNLIFNGSHVVGEETFFDETIIFAITASNIDGITVREERIILRNN